METPAEELPPIPTEPVKEEVVKDEKPKKVKASKPKPSKVEVKYVPVPGGVKPVKVKVAAKPKAKKTKVAKVKAAKPKKEKTRKPGPGTKKFKFKDPKTQGECDVVGCKRLAKTAKSFRCSIHTSAVRKAQLKENNKVWHKRVDDGTAKHHAVYKGHVTEWAGLNPDKAKAYVKAGKSIVDIKEFIPLLSKAKEAKVKEKAPTKKLVKAKVKKSVKPVDKKAA